MNGVTRGLSAVAEIRGWVAEGVITALDTHADLGWVATVSLQPTGREVLASVAHLGSAAAGGMFFPVAVDDAVLVYFPDGDPNRAVCIGGLPSSASAVPSCYDNSTPQLVHPNGMEFRTGETATITPVVTEPLLTDMLPWVAAVTSGLAAFGIATPTTLASNLPTAYRSAAIKSE